MTCRTRAASSRNGPSSGNPATTASAPRARSVPSGSAGAFRPGTEMTARSRWGSKTTTEPCNAGPVPLTRTVTSSMPATTCALVTTRPGARTQPLPSWPRRQAAATPVTLTSEAWAATTPAPPRTADDGGSTAMIGSVVRPSKTRGKPPRSSTWRNPAKSAPVWGGTSASTTASTRDSPMVRATIDAVLPRRPAATNHTRTATAIRLATPPSTASAATTGPACRCRRIRRAK